MAKVSIIVPCYNEGHYLSDALTSIINNTYNDWECIIIDDGSTDNTKNVANRFCRYDKRIKYLYQQNSGVCIARNNAIKHSVGKYILCLDADDKISDKYIELCVKELEGNELISIVTCNYKLFGRKKKKIRLEPYSIESLMGHNLFINCSMFKKSDFDSVGGFNLNMKNGLEDWDFWLSILGNGGRVKYLDGYHFFYRIKHKNKSRNRSVALHNLEILKYQIWENHKNLYSKYYYNPKFSMDYRNVVNSLEYKIGKIILFPFRKIKEFLDI